MDSFLIPKIIDVNITNVELGIPAVDIAKDRVSGDQNPFSFSSYGKLQGLRHNIIPCLVEDKNGALWIGTLGGGITKFDGKFFTHYTKKEGLINNSILCMLEDKKGNLWFGTLAGVCSFDGRNFIQFSDSEGLLNEEIKCMKEDAQGNLWFGTTRGLVKYDGATMVHFTTKEGLSHNNIECIAGDDAGNLWIGTFGGGVCKYDGERFIHFTQKDGLPSNFVSSVLSDNNNTIWISTYTDGVCKYDGKFIIPVTNKEGLPDNNIQSVIQARNGDLWFASNSSGLTKFDGQLFTSYKEKEGLNSTYILALLEDKSGNLWIGTEGGGLYIYQGHRFTHFDKTEGLSHNEVFSILQDKKKNFRFGTSGGGVNFYDGKSFSHYTETQGLSQNFIYSIIEDSRGNLWFGTNGGGVTKFDGEQFIHYTEKDGLSNNVVLSILEDQKGVLWFGTRGGGVCKFKPHVYGDGGEFMQYRQENGLSDNVVFSIIEATDGNLWFGTGNGAAKFDGTRFVHFSEAQGIPLNIVLSILEDNNGNIWFGTDGNGVIKYNGDHFLTLTENEGLANNAVLSILQAKNGNIYFGTRMGLSILNNNKLNRQNATMSFGQSDIHFKNFKYEDGFLGVGCWRNSLLENEDGSIFIGANDRLTLLHSNHRQEDSVVPDIQLTEILLFNERIPWKLLRKIKDTTILLSNGVRVGDLQFDDLSPLYHIPNNLSLKHNNNFITFNFIGITLDQPQNIKYQYRLVGLEDHWSALINRTEVSYGNLPHGQYELLIKCTNSTGFWSKELAYPFSIRPPWWQTKGSYILYSGIVIGLLYSGYRFNKQRIIRKERDIAQKRELEQAKLIDKAYTDLKSTQAQLIQSEKMASLGELTAGIAHEIQNPLNFVNNFSEVNSELIQELKGERLKVKGERRENLEDELLNDIDENEKKINFHGKRADAIVKNMLQHSRNANGQKETTDLNALCDEYLRLAYHAFQAGLKAKGKTFQADFSFDPDPDLPKVNIVPQEVGRVLLNLINNAFYAVGERMRAGSPDQGIGAVGERMRVKDPEHSLVTESPERSLGTANTKSKSLKDEEYKPAVRVSTKWIKANSGNLAEIRIEDNGSGIPGEILAKIFQPFFTTKPTGEGTGLGLSLAYDIVKAQHGEILVKSKESLGSEFIIQLPVL